MISNTFPTIIRTARDEDYESIGRIYTAAFLDDPMTQLLSSQVDGEDLFNWIWINGAKAEVAKGVSNVFVVERTDMKEVIGLAWIKKYSRTDPPKHETEDSFPKGFNITEWYKKENPGLEWLHSLVEKYGEFLGKGLSYRAVPARLIVNRRVSDVLEFAIVPGYQSQGFGKALMLHIIDYAKEQGLNVALTASSGMCLSRP